MTQSSHRSDRSPLSRDFVAALGDQYALGEELGRGGSAIVYRATDVRHDRSVAIKVLRAELASSIGGERFLREIRIAAGLTHPHVMPVLDSGDAGGTLYYVMPFLGGESLRQRLMRDRQLPMDEALHLTRAVASALQYAHDRGIVHRDVKPENILLASKSATAGAVDACLADFGLARLVIAASGDSITESGVAVGTVAYMSPEQSSPGDVVDARTDQYSLACVLFEMLAGVAPYHGADARAILARHRLDPVPRIQHIRESIPAGIDEAIARAMAKTPVDRFTSVSEFVQALEAAVTADVVARASESRPHSVTTPATARRRRIRALLIAAGVVTLAVVAVLARTLLRPLTDGQALDASRVAVAPFDVFVADDAVWRFGMVDVLTRNLDGAGPLRTVPASVVITGWHEGVDRPDDASADRLARRTGAGLVVFGEVHRNPVQLRATLYDVAAQHALHQWTITDRDGRGVVQLADSLTATVLDLLSRSRPIAAVRRPSLASTNLESLKLFLQGEQFFRHNQYREAGQAYADALALDSTALALHGMRRALRTLNGENDPTSFVHALHAGRLNHGLGPRDSLLIAADSLAAARPREQIFDTATHHNLLRRFHVLAAAAQAYPDDPEIWEEVGEARHHLGDRVGETPERALEAFERAIALDPGYSPPYFHAVELALGLRSLDSVKALVTQYLQRVPNDTRFRATNEVLNVLGAGRPLDSAILRRLNPKDLSSAAYQFRRWRGPPYPSEQIRRFLLDVPVTDSGPGTDYNWLVVELLYQGRVHEAASLLLPQQLEANPNLIFPLTVLNGMTADSADHVVQRWLRSGNDPAVLAALAWWYRSRDTASLSLAHDRFERLAGARNTPTGERALAAYGAVAAELYLSLAAGDTARALTSASRLPDLCSWHCVPERLQIVELLAAKGRVADAERVLDSHPPSAAPFTVTEVQWELARARIAWTRLSDATLTSDDKQREREHARRGFSFVISAWCRADAALQPSVREAMDRLRTMGPLRPQACVVR